VGSRGGGSEEATGHGLPQLIINGFHKIMFCLPFVGGPPILEIEIRLGVRKRGTHGNREKDQTD